MAWCPKCKCEYVEGVKICADCGVDLVEHLKEEKVISDWDKEIVARAKAMMLEETVEDSSSEEYDDTASKEPETDSRIQFADDADADEDEEKSIYHGRYINHEERAQENKSSGVALLIVGVIGFILIVLFFFDLLPIKRLGVNKYMITGIMGSLFVLFVIMGIVSLRNSKILAKKAKNENNLTTQIQKWCTDNISAEAIDKSLSFEPGDGEELKYFQRFEKMKELVKKQFVNLDEAYLDRLMDEIYPMIFEDGQA